MVLNTTILRQRNENWRIVLRVNIYSQEITNEIQIVEKEGLDSKGVPRTFRGLRFIMKSHDDLHHTEKDDDRSGVTFWLANPEKTNTDNLLLVAHWLIDALKYQNKPKVQGFCEAQYAGPPKAPWLFR